MGYCFFLIVLTANSCPFFYKNYQSNFYFLEYFCTRLIDGSFAFFSPAHQFLVSLPNWNILVSFVLNMFQLQILILFHTST